MDTWTYFRYRPITSVSEPFSKHIMWCLVYKLSMTSTFSAQISISQSTFQLLLHENIRLCSGLVVGRSGYQHVRANRSIVLRVHCFVSTMMKLYLQSSFIASRKLMYRYLVIHYHPGTFFLGLDHSFNVSVIFIQKGWSAKKWFWRNAPHSAIV